MKIPKTVKVIAKHRGEWEIDGNKGLAFYLVTVVTGACKPCVEKCTPSIFDIIEVGKTFTEDSIGYDRNGKIAIVDLKGGE